MKNARIFVAVEIIFHSVLRTQELSVIAITQNSTSVKRWSPQNKIPKNKYGFQTVFLWVIPFDIYRK